MAKNTLKELRRLHLEQTELQLDLAELKLEAQNHPLKPGPGQGPTEKWTAVSRKFAEERAEIVVDLQKNLLEIAKVRDALRDDPIPMVSLLYIIDTLVSIESRIKETPEQAWDDLSTFIDGLEQDEARVYEIKENHNG